MKWRSDPCEIMELGIVPLWWIPFSIGSIPTRIFPYTIPLPIYEGSTPVETG
ncbi:hypothetical protein [Nostoc sp. FACHB-892]